MSESTAPILLITATVKPPSDAINLQRVDVSLRLADYKAGLQFYLGLLEQGTLSAIVFAENSNVDISELKCVAAKSTCANRVEFVQFDGLDHPGAYGRGYGEFKLLDYAMRHSALIQAADHSTEIWKVTGRYQITNLAQIMAKRGHGREMWLHCRNRPVRWADMYVMGWRRSFYASHLYGVYESLKDKPGFGAEMSFRKYVDGLSKRVPIERRLYPVPEIVGIRGYDGANYGDARLKQLVRKAVRIIAPWVWI